MIETLTIRNLGVITEATVELGSGLTVVSGETGAGKTMIVTALGLLLGARADAGAVRAGAKQASVDGHLVFDPRRPQARRVAERVADAGGEVEDGELLLSRSVLASGRSRGFAGGRSVPVSLLTELGADLVAVHGQSEQIRLRSAAAQRDVLDRFAGESLQAVLDRYREAYRGWRRADEELTELRSQAATRAQETDLLRFGLEEIDAIRPLPGEDEQLKATAQRLAHQEDLRISAERAHLLVAGGDLGADDGGSAAALLDEAVRSLGSSSEHDEQLRVIADRARDLGYQVADLGAELGGYLASMLAGADADNAQDLAAIEERRSDLAKLTRKYSQGQTVDEVLEWERSAAERLDAIENDDGRIGELELLAAEQRAAAESDAALLRELREEAAGKLGAAVTGELRALSMPDAELRVEVSDAGELGRSGGDVVSLLLVAHAGAQARELSRGASGGELSRVMLALEVVIAEVDPVPTFVFDEVDSGVGGKAAVEIGRRLARLARTSQVLVVTHLPQVAAWADDHVVVSKTADADAGVTLSDVSGLDRQGRIVELARMLAGRDESASALAHAEELLVAAAGEKSAWSAARRA